jgi:hypothetical protein
LLREIWLVGPLCGVAIRLHTKSSRNKCPRKGQTGHPSPSQPTPVSRSQRPYPIFSRDFSKPKLPIKREFLQTLQKLEFLQLRFLPDEERRQNGTLRVNATQLSGPTSKRLSEQAGGKGESKCVMFIR